MIPQDAAPAAFIGAKRGALRRVYIGLLLVLWAAASMAFWALLLRGTILLGERATAIIGRWLS